MLPDYNELRHKFSFCSSAEITRFLDDVALAARAVCDERGIEIARAGASDREAGAGESPPPVEESVSSDALTDQNQVVCSKSGDTGAAAPPDGDDAAPGGTGTETEPDSANETALEAGADAQAHRASPRTLNLKPREKTSWLHQD